MALVLLDRVRETTTTTGTGTITLLGAVASFQAFSAIGNGNTTYYTIVDGTAGTWEVGIGTYTASGTTLSRDTVISSSNGGALVPFGAGAKDVFVTYPAEKAIYEEANGDTLINAGPITVLGSGTGSPVAYTDTLGRFYGNVNNYQQVYVQNQNSGAEASSDFVTYNNLGDGLTYFVDMGINSSNYNSAVYPIFPANSAYMFSGGDTGVPSALYFGTSTGGDIVWFTGGVDTSDIKMVLKDTTGNLLIGTTTDGGQKLQVTGSAYISGATTFGSTVTLNADPTLALQAATKQYVDTAVSTGLHVHEAVRVSTQSNLTATYNNGTAGVGATLTNSSTQTALVIDGITMAVNDRVLVWQQSAQAQNGVYVVSNIGSGSTNWVLTRSSDADSYVPLSDTGLGGGDYFFVQSGTLGAGDSYICTNDGAITFGTTAITFAQFSGAITYTGGTNIDVTGQTISLTGTVGPTNGGTGVNTVSTGDLLYGSASNTWSKLGLGAANKSLIVNSAGTQIEWNAIPIDQSGAVSGALPAVNGGTGASSYTQGEMLYANSSTSLDKVTPNATTTKKFLTQTGTGSAAQAPSWLTISAADVSGLAPSATTDTTDAGNISTGTLPSGRLIGAYTQVTGVGTLTSGTWNASTITVGYGGTGLTTYATGDLIYASATNTLSKLAAGTDGYVLTLAGGVPTWAAGASTGVSSFQTSLTGLTPSTSTTGAVTLAGTLGVDSGGTGQASYTDGQLLIGNSTGNTLSKATLTAGANITITNGAGTITIASTGGGGGGSANPEATNGIYVNSNTISSNYTVATGFNGMSSGPVTINTGISVTVANGSRWVVL